MGKLTGLLAASAVLVLVPWQALAQNSGGGSETISKCCHVAAGTPVELEMVEAVSSRTHIRGDRFAVRLRLPIMADDVTAIPAGTPGVGEIVHAERSRGGGKPGELLLAARYLDLNGVQIPLRAMKLGGQGKDRSGTAIGVAVAIGPFAQFIRGEEIEIPSGTVAGAKLAVELSALPLHSEPPPPTGQPTSSSTTKE